MGEWAELCLGSARRRTFRRERARATETIKPRTTHRAGRATVLQWTLACKVPQRLGPTPHMARLAAWRTSAAHLSNVPR